MRDIYEADDLFDTGDLYGTSTKDTFQNENYYTYEDKYQSNDVQIHAPRTFH